jgi:hypothetical protein
MATLLFLEYEFTIIYKVGRTHVGVDVLSKLLDSSKILGVLDQAVDALLFYVKPIWMKEVRSYLEISQILKTLNLI